MVEATNWRHDEQRKTFLWHAWSVAHLVGSAVACMFSDKAKFPTLDEVLNPKPVRKHTDEELSRMRAANARIRQIAEHAKREAARG